jgi:hypothetical protein
VALTQAYTGRTFYYARQETPKGKLTLAVAYQVGEERVLSPLDTGAECGIFPAELAAALGYDDPTQGVPTTLDTRYGRYAGHLVRIPVSIPAEEGDGIEVDLTWLVIPDWPGPLSSVGVAAWNASALPWTLLRVRSAFTSGQSLNDCGADYLGVSLASA